MFFFNDKFIKHLLIYQKSINLNILGLLSMWNQEKNNMNELLEQMDCIRTTMSRCKSPSSFKPWVVKMAEKIKENLSGIILWCRSITKIIRNQVSFFCKSIQTFKIFHSFEYILDKFFSLID